MTHSLFFVSKFELIRTVPFSTLAYWGQSYSFPLSIVKEIERICANFWWKGRMHGWKWEDICRPKRERVYSVRRTRIYVQLLA